MSIGDENLFHAARCKVLRRKLRHLSRAENERRAPLEVAEFGANQLDRRIADRDRIISNARLRTNALSRLNCTMKERV